VRVAVARGLRARDERALGDVHERRERHVVERDLDSPAGALDQRGQDRGRGRVAGEHVDDGHADLRRRPVGLAGDRHQAALGLEDEVVAGPVVAEAADRAVDQLRVLARELLVPGAEPLGGAGPEVLDHDVRVAGEPP
jgi:hypothetical protein